MEPTPAPTPTPTRYRLEIPGMLPPTLNELMRGKLRRRMQLERRWHDETAKARLVFQIPRATVKRRVTLHIVLDAGERGADVDGYWKGTLDALVRCVALCGDTRRWAELNPVVYSRQPGARQTIIELEDIT